MIKPNNKNKGKGGVLKDSSYSLLNRASISKHVGFPERYTTSVATEFSCFIPASMATAAYGNYFSVCVNSIFQTLAQGSFTPLTGNGTYAYGFEGHVVQGNSVSANPMWYTELAAIYTSYKVIQYMLKVTCRSPSTSDIFEICMIPLGVETIPSATQANVNTRVMLSQPRAVHKLCANGGTAQADSVRLRQRVSNLLNIRDGAWLDYPPTPVSQQPGSIGGQSIQGYVGFFLQMATGSDNVGAISVDIELEQQVEFTDIIQPFS